MDKTLAKYASYPTSGKESYLTKDSEYEEKETGEIREQTFFAWFPVYIGQQDLIPLRGCKFTWFKQVKVIQKKVLYRTSDFDSGWSYQSYWNNWKTKWITVDVIRLK